MNEAKLIKKEIIPFVGEKLDEFKISPETTAFFFASTTKEILKDIENKDVKEIIIRMMLDDDYEI